MVFYAPAQAQSRRLDYLDYSDSDSNHHNPGYAERGYCGGFKTEAQRHTWGNHSNQDSLPWYRGHQLGIMVPTWFITLTIFVQWIRCWRVTRDGGRDWDLRGLHTRRPSLQLALGTRFITWPFLSLNFSLQFWQKFHLDEKEFTGVENLWWSPSTMFRISLLLSSRFLFLAPFLSLGQSFWSQWWWQSRSFLMINHDHHQGVIRAEATYCPLPHHHHHHRHLHRHHHRRRHCHHRHHQGVIRAEATFLTPSGDNFGCVWIRVAVDH